VSGQALRHARLQDWLTWQENLHPAAIELGLDRVGRVWDRLGPRALPFPVISVAGTNGKGSTVAMLEAIYGAAGYRTAAYTSPHLLRYNERIRLDGQEVSDPELCAAFARVDAARGAESLTYFEFGTLAALDLFLRARPDLAILEVGLGGRLDAVNLFDADLAIITSIGRDHMAWLGETLEEIALEKAGILRPGRPALFGHRQPLPVLLARAAELGCPTQVLGRDFDWTEEPPGWRWTGPGLPPSEPGHPGPAGPRPIRQRRDRHHGHPPVAGSASPLRGPSTPGAATGAPARPLPGVVGTADLDPGCRPQWPSGPGPGR
jgi:dihydrofolate synthase/folylpolyglutamate synthase